jgi:aldehyde dehydrogenase (NAD+)
MIAAICAGNTVVLKPSELTPHTSNLLKKMVESIFESNIAMVFLGGKEKTEELLEFNFDHVFFTGSTHVGKLIAEKCSKNLIPYTLELGGKSPTIIDKSADLDLATDKILWGKFLNRGQSCIAPDFACVHADIVDSFINLLNEKIKKIDLEDKAKIITGKHEKRLNDLLGFEIKNQALIVLKIENKNHPLMQEEIFGPILPVLCYNSESELFNLAISNEKPLALYIFSNDNQFINRALTNIPSGGAAINSVLVHFGNHNLPFGGIGHSGVGSYHGKFGFDEMSHHRAVIRQNFLSMLRFAYMPPYTEFKFKIANIFKKM